VESIEAVYLARALASRTCASKISATLENEQNPKWQSYKTELVLVLRGFVSA